VLAGVVAGVVAGAVVLAGVVAGAVVLTGVVLVGVPAWATIVDGIVVPDALPSVKRVVGSAAIIESVWGSKVIIRDTTTNQCRTLDLALEISTDLEVG
jgi:hypothetical protein